MSKKSFPNPQPRSKTKRHSSRTSRPASVLSYWLAAFLILLLGLAYVFLATKPQCKKTIIPAGTEIGGVQLSKDTDYNYLVRMGVVYGPPKPSGISAPLICR